MKFYEKFVPDEANASRLLVELAGAHCRSRCAGEYSPQHASGLSLSRPLFF
jgi:hypothetical protein